MRRQLVILVEMIALLSVNLHRRIFSAASSCVGGMARGQYAFQFARTTGPRSIVDADATAVSATRRPSVLEYERRCRTTSNKRSLHCGHSRDCITYPLATGVTPLTILLTLQAMHLASETTAAVTFHLQHPPCVDL
jgi:hypothetical protein